METVEEIVELIRKYDDDTYVWKEQALYGMPVEEAKRFEEVTGYDFSPEEDWRGDDGDHDSYFWVFSLTKDEVKRFFMIDGWYNSHEGTECDNPFDLTEVHQVEKTITVWEAK